MIIMSYLKLWVHKVQTILTLFSYINLCMCKSVENPQIFGFFYDFLMCSADVLTSLDINLARRFPNKTLFTCFGVEQTFFFP